MENADREKLMNLYNESSPPYLRLKRFLDSPPMKQGTVNLLEYLEKEGEHRITRFNSTWVGDLRDYFKNSKDKYVKDSVNYLYKLHEKAKGEVSKAREVLENSEKFSKEWRKANELLFRAISGLKDGGNKISNIDSSEKLFEKLGIKLLGEIKKRYGWTEELQEDYGTYVRALRNAGIEDSSEGTSLENKVVSSVFIGFAIAGLFFATPSLTGNVISSNAASSNFLGALLFILGIIGFYFNKK
ncbi:MAG: hypothetical protein KC516_03495 [Nanoarchaeota archaeon]|nr:hypothetical protein [Nanoarchaeota archaeon]